MSRCKERKRKKKNKLNEEGTKDNLQLSEACSQKKNAGEKIEAITK